MNLLHREEIPLSKDKASFCKLRLHGFFKRLTFYDTPIKRKDGFYGYPQSTLGHCRGDCLTNPMFINAFWLIFNLKVTGNLFSAKVIQNPKNRN